MYKIYQVQNGDTLLSIASRLGIAADLLATINGLDINSLLVPNSYIVIPGGNAYFESYKVKKGDTLYEIANKFNVNVDQLLLLNGLNKNDYIYPEQTIMVPSDNSGFYVTKEGDTLQFVQNALKLPIEQLVSQNGTLFLAPDQLIVYKK